MEASWGPCGGLLRASWGPLGGSLGASWELLGASWRPLGGSWGFLCASWGLPSQKMIFDCGLDATWRRLGVDLGPSWGRLGVVLGSSWRLLGPLGAILEPLGAVLGLLGRLLGPSCSHLGRLKMQIAEKPNNAISPTRNCHFGRQDEAKMRPRWAKRGPRWAKMGPSRPKLSPSWSQVGILRRSWRHLAVLARFEGVLESSGAALRDCGGFLEQ